MALKLGTLFYEFGADTSKLKKAQKEVVATNETVGKSFKRLGAMIAGALSIETARRILVIADNMTRIKGKIASLTKSQKEADKTFKGLVSTANELGIQLDGVVSSYQRFSLVRGIVGASNAQTIQFTKNIQKLGIVSGATGQEITSTSIQIGQALANNFEAAAQEINSINEQMPEVARAVERSLNLIPGSFKKAVTSGQVTAEQFFNAILQQTDTIDARFNKLPVTIERATAKLANNFAVALTEADDILGTTQNIAGSIEESSMLLATDFSEALIHARMGFIQLFGTIDRGFINLKAGTRKFVMNLGLAIQNLTGLQTQGSLKGLAEIENERKTAIKTAQDVTSAFVAELEKRRQARIAARLLEKNVGSISRLDNKADKVGGGAGASVEDENKELDRIVKSMANETEAIKIALQERETTILALEEITEKKRFELLTKSANIRNKQIKALEQSREQQAIAVAQSLGDKINDVMKATGKEGTVIAKALFLANKAIQVASIISATHAAAANASITPSIAGPFGYFTTKAGVMASGMASAGIVAGMAVGNTFKGGGRQAGGRAFAGAAHPITEDGNPEIFQQGARQFLLPGNKSGNVIPLHEGGAGGGPSITINNNASGVDVSVQSVSRDEVIMLVQRAEEQAVNRVNTSLSRGQGSTARAMSQGFKNERNIR